MTRAAKTCTGKPGISSPHDWVLQDKLNEKTTLKSGKTKHTRHFSCSTCKGRMVETIWVVKGKVENSRLQWRDPAAAVAT